MESSLNEKESLKLIREMIDSTKTNYSNNSTYYLLWGYVVLIAGLIEYFMIAQIHSEFHWIVWPIAMPLTGLASWIIGYRHSRAAQVKSHLDEAIDYLWIGVACMIFIALFLTKHIGWTNGFALITSIYGLGTFVSGGLLKYRPLMAGGILAWVITLIMIFVPIFQVFENTVLMLCASIVVSYLIPGHMLRSLKSRNCE